MTDLEYCCECDEPTGRAGRTEDSLYCDDCDSGPYCDECFGKHQHTTRKFRHPLTNAAAGYVAQLEERVRKLEEENGRLRHSLDAIRTLTKEDYARNEARAALRR